MRKLQRLKEFVGESIRVLRITKKPDREEYKVIVKVAGLGIIVIGAIGMILFLLRQLLIGPIA
jgi:protein transport protein SEC61 subunit gamma-like protein